MEYLLVYSANLWLWVDEYNTDLEGPFKDESLGHATR